MAIDLEKYKLPTNSSVNLDKYKTVQESSPIPDTRSISDKIWEGIASVGNATNKIFQGKQVGEAIGTLGGYGVTTIKESLGLSPQGATRAYDLSSPNIKQVAGDVISGAASVGGFKGLGTTGSLAQKILTNIGLGGAISGGKTLAEGGTEEQTIKSTLYGGTIGGALPIAGKGLSFIGNQIKQLPARVINSALNRSKAQVLQDISKDKVDDFVNYVIKNKSVGTASNLLDESQNNIKILSNKINSYLETVVRKTGEKVTIGVDNFLDEISKLPEAEGALLKRIDIKNIVERLAPQTKKLLSKISLTPVEANKLRQLIDLTLGDRAFLGGQLSSDKIILKKFADSLRETVKNKAPEGTRELFKELSNEIRFRDGLLGKIAKRAGNQILTFGDFIGGGLGGIFGGGFGGAVAGVATRRAIESVPFKLTVAKLINSLTKAEPFLQSLEPAVQTEILNLFSDIFSPEKSDEITTNKTPQNQ